MLLPMGWELCSHIMWTSIPRSLIVFASQSLAPLEKRYGQLDKEGLAIVFRVKKFHRYLFGCHFSSDHKPLQYLFSETQPVPPMALARIQRWALILSAYSHTIAYKPGGDHINADVLSETVLLLDTLHGPLTAIQIKQWTDRDPLLSSLRNMALHGRYSANKEQLRPFTGQKDKLSIQDGCILWRSRVVIPQAGHAAVMRELHEGHPSICRMKSLACSIAWWPGIDADLERIVKDCHKCQINHKSPAPAPLHSSK